MSAMRYSVLHRMAASLMILILAACAPPALVNTPSPATPMTPVPSATPMPERPTSTPVAPIVRLPMTTMAPLLPTATAAISSEPVAGEFVQPDLGISLQYPKDWATQDGENPLILTWLFDPAGDIVAVLFYDAIPPGASLEDAAKQVRDATSAGVGNVRVLADQEMKLGNGLAAWRSEYSGSQNNGDPVQVVLVSAVRGGHIVSLMVFGAPEQLDRQKPVVEALVDGLVVGAPLRHGVPEDQAFLTTGGESTNPRVYDPATGHSDNRVFSGLVSFDQHLQVVPDLAEGWDISPDGMLYTFHLRKNARFHNGRPVTAQDVIYSWERAADPEIRSDTVLTYLGDIVGVAERRSGQAAAIAGLAALDDHTLQVRIDAPKPYFLMKLTYRTAFVVDHFNVESGPDWYRTPNGTGPYRLARWEPNKLRLYERNPDFYLDPPAIRYVVEQIYAGVGIRMYETGDVDIAGVSSYDLDRMRDPSEPLHNELIGGVSMCTSFIAFDVQQKPFDDPKVRQAFALAFDRARYLEIVLRGNGVPARGLYPPALPGYSAGLRGLDFDPDLARQRLAESTYGEAAKLPPIVFTQSGFGGDAGSSTEALMAMWQQVLGVTVQVENLEPNKALDEIRAGNHGQIFWHGWCADYPDPENFADALFYSGAQQNLGHYANPALDRLLEQARVERDVERRIAMYQQAEQMIVDDAPGVFIVHGLSHLLVKSRIKGYVLTPIDIPIERYLSIDSSTEK